MLDYTKFLFKNFDEIDEFEEMIRARIYKNEVVKIVGNFGYSKNKWMIDTKNGTIIVDDSKLQKIYTDEDFLKKFKYRG